MLDKRLFITIFNSIYDTHGTRLETSFTDFLYSLKTPQIVNKSQAEYEKLSKSEQTELKFGNCYCPGVFDSDIRKGAANAEASILVIDVDASRPTLHNDFQKALPGLKVFSHTTFSSRDDNLRERILIQLNRTVNAEEYKSIAKAVAEKVKCTFDENCFRINQPILFPRVLKDVPYHYDEWGSEPLDVDELLGITKEADSVETENENANNSSVDSSAERKPYGWIQGLVRRTSYKGNCRGCT